MAATRLELEALQAAGSLEGAIALRLALSLDDPDLAASSVSALAGQLARTMASVRERAPRQPDALDELAARAGRKLGTA